MNKYWWLKIDLNFFEKPEISYLLSQKNGSDFVIIYQIICTKVANQNGKLQEQIGEIVVKFDAEKITREVKYFDKKVVEKALDLFEQLGLIGYDDDGEKALLSINEMVGAGSANREAIKKRQQREGQKRDKKGTKCPENVPDDVPKMSPQETDKKGTKCPTELRDKSIDIKEVFVNTNTKKRSAFKKPTVDEVLEYCNERSNGIDANEFIDFYQSKGWMVGKDPMKDWKACIRTWESRRKKEAHPDTLPAYERDSSLDDLF